MKKVVSFLVCLFMFLSFPAEGMADGYQKIDDLGVSVLLPGNMYVATRDTPKNAQVWKDLHFSYDDMILSNTYLYAKTEDKIYAITVNGYQDLGNMDDFNSYSDEELEELYKEIFRSLDEYFQITIPRNSMYSTEDTSFFIYDMYDDSIGTTRSYWTVHGGNLIVLGMASSSGEIDSYLNSVLMSIADNLVFESKPFGNVSTPKSSNRDSTEGGNVGLVVFGLIVVVLFFFLLLSGPSESEKRKEEQIKAARERVQEQNARKVSVTMGDSFEEIRKYKDLLDEGIISQEEFDKKKKELLGL